MNQFFKESSNSHYQFIETAAKSAFIYWILSTGEISEVNRINEFPGLFNNQDKVTSLKGLLLRDVIPWKIYNRVEQKANIFLNSNKSNWHKNFIVSFALNISPGNDNSRRSMMVYIHLNRRIDTGLITLSCTEALEQLNNKIMLITELPDNKKGRVVCVCSIHNNLFISLRNNEYDILQLLAKGYTTETIAHFQCISKHTVNRYRNILLHKFNAKNVFQLISHAYQEGYL